MDQFMMDSVELHQAEDQQETTKLTPEQEPAHGKETSTLSQEEVKDTERYGLIVRKQRPTETLTEEH